jgi:hypothetical protein
MAVAYAINVRSSPACWVAPRANIRIQVGGKIKKGYGGPTRIRTTPENKDKSEESWF